MISFDVETLGLESNAVVLSVGAIAFDLSDKERDADLTVNEKYQKYLTNSCFVKFNTDNQVTVGRKVEKDALEWWKKQAEIPIKRSLRRTDTDLPVRTGLEQLTQYCNGHKTFWQRGSLDQMIIDNLCRQFNIPLLCNYWDWMDFRTALALTKETAARGYCVIPEFDEYQVIKHDPVHDAAFDIIMLLYGE